MRDQADLFVGTAGYYARFRPPYPKELLDVVLGYTAPGEPSRLLDLGCGTGELAVPLSSHFTECRAVDVSAEMLRHGRERAAVSDRTNIVWHEAPAESVTADDQSIDLVTIGAAFHWMDRRLVAGRAARWLRSGGALVIAGTNSTWTGTEEWHGITRDVITRWLGPQRRAGRGTFEKKERHEDALRAVGFTNLAEHRFNVPHTWTLDDYIGYLYSTSFASRDVLGEAQADFERDLRAALLEYDGTGRYTEAISFHCIAATVAS